MSNVGVIILYTGDGLNFFPLTFGQLPVPSPKVTLRLERRVEMNGGAYVLELRGRSQPAIGPEGFGLSAHLSQRTG